MLKSCLFNVQKVPFYTVSYCIKLVNNFWTCICNCSEMIYMSNKILHEKTFHSETYLIFYILFLCVIFSFCVYTWRLIFNVKSNFDGTGGRYRYHTVSQTTELYLQMNQHYKENSNSMCFNLLCVQKVLNHFM